MQFSYLHFKHPNILHTSDELSRADFFLGSITPNPPEMKELVQSYPMWNMENAFIYYHIFISGVLGVIDPRKKYGRESSSEVRKMMGCLKCKYENCIFLSENAFIQVCNGSFNQCHFFHLLS